MTDQTLSPRRGILVTGASGTVGQAVVAALSAAGETVVAGMRDPRAWLAEGARRASGTAAGQHPTAPGGVRPGAAQTGPTRPGGVRPGAAHTGPARPGPARPAAAHGSAPARPGGKPARAPNQKPDRHPAAKPDTLAAASPAGRTVGKPGAAAVSATADGAVVRAFDFADRSTWARALAGVDRVFLIVPPTVGDVGRTIIPFIDQAMEDAGVRQIVFLSAPGARFDNRSPHHLVELYLRRTRTPFTILRPNLIMQTLSTRYRDDIRLRGEIVLPAAGASAAFVDANDVGRVAAKVLGEPGHLGKVYALAGEQSLSFAQVAEVLTEVLGRPIRYTATSEAEYAELATKQGAPAADVAAQAAWFKAVRRRLTALPNRSIRKLTGRPATSLQGFVAEHRQAWL